ncbi:MAG: DNA mismatch repair endonuclease MutL [Candidatus Zixiibacteriota bacterium]
MSNSPSLATRRRIRPLPERLVNKIAAGEVIERPAAVLKELVENSLDAGATRVDIVVEKSGTKLISVADNGCGIAAEQIEVAFARHATSKISDFSDLENLASYGFRGEALPSIASVSRTRLVSRTEEADSGQEIIIEGGVVQNLKPIAAPVGTIVEVSNLFFNTPARRKFLKAEVTEARHLTRTAVALALSAPHIKFSYRLNGKEVYNLSAETDSSFRRRVSNLLFAGQENSLLELRSQIDGIDILGYISTPQSARQNQYGLYLFINGRFIKSTNLMHAIIAGYGEALPRGNYPAGAVNLRIEPSRVDVNVHPTKAEVRLSEESQVHDLLFQAVRRGLRESGQNPGSIASTGVTADAKTWVRQAYRRADAAPSGGFAANQEFLKQLYGGMDSGQTVDSSAAHNDSRQELPGVELVDVTTGEMLTRDEILFLGQFAELYLIFMSRVEIFVIDQHTAHERVLYEENLETINRGSGVAQNLLFPVTISLAPDRYALFEETAGLLQAAGFVAEPFGPRTVLLSAVPSVLSRKSPEKVFLQIIDDIGVIKGAEHDLKKAVAQSIACRSAVMSGDRLGAEEALNLFKRLLAAKDNYCCPHGRPTIFRISKSELDFKFGRK